MKFVISPYTLNLGIVLLFRQSTRTRSLLKSSDKTRINGINVKVSLEIFKLIQNNSIYRPPLDPILPALQARKFRMKTRNHHHHQHHHLHHNKITSRLEYFKVATIIPTSYFEIIAFSWIWIEIEFYIKKWLFICQRLIP